MVSDPSDTPDPALLAELRALREKQAALERTVQDLARAVAETRELQQKTEEEHAEQTGLLAWRTNHLQQLVYDILRSRIWRTLTSGGALALRLRHLLRRGRIQLAPYAGPSVGGGRGDYARWIAEFEKPDPSLVRLKLTAFDEKPLISLLLPASRATPEFLRQTIDSVLRQSYPRWELYIVSSTSESLELDDRIKVIRLPPDQGIPAALNAALELAAGEFVALLDPPDQLAPHALYHFVDALNRDPEADLFYSDEDRMDASGDRQRPFFKPDWSPDLILSTNYIGHLMVFRRDLCRQAGGFRGECDSGQSHDLVLRMSRLAGKIVHIPKILYHVSAHRDHACEASQPALESHLLAAGVEATVESSKVFSGWRVRYAIPENQRVRIIIPSRKVGILERCLDSVTRQTDYPHYEILVADNSTDSAIERLIRARGIGYFDYRNRPFDFSAINNAATRDIQDPLLLFLNDDTTVITPGWLTAMVELASRKEVGAVGAKLLYPNGVIQHAGVALGLFGICGHVFKGLPADNPGYFGLPHLIRNVSAVTGACLMASTRLFRECGGFDSALPVAYQDIDLCLKFQQKGYRVLYTPHAQLYHHESFSKRPEDLDPTLSETRLFQARWKDVIDHDPFYSPNLTRTAEDYSPRSRNPQPAA